MHRTALIRNRCAGEQTRRREQSSRGAGIPGHPAPGWETGLRYDLLGSIAGREAKETKLQGKPAWGISTLEGLQKPERVESGRWVRNTLG